jgi:hypothetical protein
MLRITTNENADRVLMKLEGRLVGPWVAELETCWRGMFANLGRRSLSIDLTGVRSMDAAGRCTLALLHLHGAQLLATGCGSSQTIKDIIDSWPADTTPLGQPAVLKKERKS